MNAGYPASQLAAQSARRVPVAGARIVDGCGMVQAVVAIEVPNPIARANHLSARQSPGSCRSLCHVVARHERMSAVCGRSTGDGRQGWINPKVAGWCRDNMRKIDKRPASRSRLALRDMRLRAGLTEQAVAARLGVTYHTIRAWEKGERAVRNEWLPELAASLGCSVTDLRQEEDVARNKRWQRAWVALTDAPKAPPRGHKE
jgi:DNA-binding XRE family transcriptional regulator